MACVFAFIGGVVLGCLSSLGVLALGYAAKDFDFEVDVCRDCLGASMGDCPTCPRRKDKVDDER